jgi:hypothetical protein
MVEQVVCANAHTFIGTPLSTFTGFITRMRGFMDRKILAEVDNPAHSTVSKDILSQIGRTLVPVSMDKEGQNLGLVGKIFTRNLRDPLTAVTPDFAAVTDNREMFGVGLYQRSYYFMSHFMYQLHDAPYLKLPFWVREFSEPFEDTEEIQA